MNNFYEIKTKKLHWINVTRPGNGQLKKIEKEHRLMHEDTQDVLPPIQRVKLIERPDYLFMILLFPVYNKEAGDIIIEEVDFFIFKDKLITVHGNKIPVIGEVFKSCRDNKTGSCANDLATLLYKIMEGLYQYCFPMLSHINLDIENVEKGLFKDYEKKYIVERILRIKTNIFDFQRAMQTHEYVINKLLRMAPALFPAKALEKYYVNLIEYNREVNTSLSGYKDVINALHETNTTLVEYRVNEIAKLLSVFAVIVFPLTLLSSIFGMNTVTTPIIGTAFDFWKIIAIMGIGGVLMIGFFKWRKWI